MKKIFAICYYGRSGSVFLQSLFDEHPNCITIPGTYISGYEGWFGYDNESGEADYLVDKFCQDYQCFFDPDFVSPYPLPACGPSPGLAQNFNKMGENADESIFVEKELFRKFLIESIGQNQTLTIDQFFVAIHRAYALALGRNWDQIKFIVFQLHTPNPSRSNFAQKFESKKIIHMIREPVQSAYSLYKQYIVENVDEGLATILDSMYRFSPLPGLEELSRAVKLEDLHTQPEKTLRMICQWIDLKWDPCLLQSTFNGKLWHNHKGTNNVQGFNNTIINKKHEGNLSEADRIRLETLFSFLYKAWDYPLTKVSFLRRFGILGTFMVEKNSPLRLMLKNRLRILKRMVYNTSWMRRILGKKPLIIVPLLK